MPADDELPPGLELPAGGPPSDSLTTEETKRGRGRPKGSGTNEAKQEALVNALVELVGDLSFIVAIVLTWPDAVLRDALAMTAEEAKAIGEPLANILSGTKFMRRYGKHLINSSDYVALAMGLAVYGLRIQPFVAARMGRTARRVVRRTVGTVGVPRDQHPEPVQAPEPAESGGFDWAAATAGPQYHAA